MRLECHGTAGCRYTPLKPSARLAAKRTWKFSLEVHGYNPQFLISRIIRDKVYDNRYWKETCFALNAETIVITQLAAKLLVFAFSFSASSEFDDTDHVFSNRL